jgi:hypothetical protein
LDLVSSCAHVFIPPVLDKRMDVLVFETSNIFMRRRHAISSWAPRDMWDSSALIEVPSIPVLALQHRHNGIPIYVLEVFHAVLAGFKYFVDRLGDAWGADRSRENLFFVFAEELINMTNMKRTSWNHGVVCEIIGKFIEFGRGLGIEAGNLCMLVQGGFGQEFALVVSMLESAKRYLTSDEQNKRHLFLDRLGHVTSAASKLLLIIEFAITNVIFGQLPGMTEDERHYFQSSGMSVKEVHFRKMTWWPNDTISWLRDASLIKPESWSEKTTFGSPTAANIIRIPKTADAFRMLTLTRRSVIPHDEDMPSPLVVPTVQVPPLKLHPYAVRIAREMTRKEEEQGMCEYTFGIDAVTWEVAKRVESRKRSRSDKERGPAIKPPRLLSKGVEWRKKFDLRVTHDVGLP